MSLDGNTDLESNRVHLFPMVGLAASIGQHLAALKHLLSCKRKSIVVALIDLKKAVLSIWKCKFHFN